jgi:Fe-S oxidoreductase
MFLSERERTETILACRFCPMCAAGDRLAGIVGRESYAPRGRAAVLFALDRGLLQPDSTIGDIMYTTLNDGLIRDWCVGNYDHEELVLDARAQLFSKGLAPERIVQHLRVVRTRQGSVAPARAVLSEHGVEVATAADTLLLAGCPGHGDAPDLATLIQMGRLFKAAGVPFAMLEAALSCGWDFYQAGDLDGARECSMLLADAVRASGAKTVVTLDADCLRMLTTRTSRLGGDLEGVRAVHATSVLDDWLARGRLAVRAKIAGPVTYHDPCALARYCDDIETPRRLLARIVEGPVVEMETHGRRANCCGAGGLLPLHRPDLAAAVGRRRVDEARRTGATILATACTGCDAMLRHADDGAVPAPRVTSIVALVARAAGVEVSSA